MGEIYLGNKLLVAEGETLPPQEIEIEGHIYEVYVSEHQDSNGYARVSAKFVRHASHVNLSNIPQGNEQLCVANGRSKDIGVKHNVTHNKS
jgi:hypothetical protein